MSYLLEIKHRGGGNTQQKLDTDAQVQMHLESLMSQDGPIEVSVFQRLRTVRRREVWDTIQAEPETK